MALSRAGARSNPVPAARICLPERDIGWRRCPTRSPRGRIYPLACLVVIAVCAFTAARERPTHRRRAVDQARPASRTRPGCAPRGTRLVDTSPEMSQTERLPRPPGNLTAVPVEQWLTYTHW